MKSKMLKRIEAIERAKKSILALTSKILNMSSESNKEGAIREKIKRNETNITNTERKLDEDTPYWRDKRTNLS